MAMGQCSDFRFERVQKTNFHLLSFGERLKRLKFFANLFTQPNGMAIKPSQQRRVEKCVTSVPPKHTLISLKDEFRFFCINLERHEYQGIT